MSTVVEPSQGILAAPDELRIRLSGVDWQTFWKLASDSRGARFAFDRGVLEIMSPGPLHESQKGLMADFVKIVSRALAIPRLPMGSTTWGNEEADRGIEADECFYFAPEKIMVANEAIARRSNDQSDYPPPDMAVEVDLRRPVIDRPAIFAAIGVAELWRFDGTKVLIEHLHDDGTYTASPTSRFLPIRVEDAHRWLIDEDSTDRSAWEERLAERARGLLKK
jgi:Uma2 family endonuclease